MDLPFNPEDVSCRLLAWYGRAGRELPWRGTRDPYRIWLSEILLQQTTVAAVIPHYHRLLDLFPDVRTLAAAPVEHVIEAWAGLGYYRRARNLHAAARQVVERFEGEFPGTLEELQRLPGIGRSTAGAVLSIAFDRPAPILDGNVRRVLCRLFALQQPARSSQAEKLLWGWAEALTPADRSHDYAQAIMDLGATLCTPTRPACHTCPLQTLCQGYRRGLQESLPLGAPKKQVPTVSQVAVALWRGDAVLVLRRPLDGMLGGLWEFPATELLDGESAQQAVLRLLRDLGLRAEVEPLTLIRHTYSHFKLQLNLFRAALVGGEVAAERESDWINAGRLAELPLHGAHKKAVPHLAPFAMMPRL